MREALQRAWLERGPLAWLLWPLALLHTLVVSTRRAMYRVGMLPSYRAPVPVIVVGNVIAGGAGKTPVVIEVVRHLQHFGWRAGVVSRGYGRRDVQCREVTPASDPAESGDEPLLIARRTGAPVFVARRRSDAVRALMAKETRTQVIVCDDGLQHLALARDIEICVFDSRGTGNGWLLPAGPLREPWPREVDFVLDPRSVRRSLAGQLVRGDGARRSIAAMRGQPIHALAGIAQPDAFFDMLRSAGLQIDKATALPDHDDLSALELAPTDVIVCTEKDAVKLWRTRPDAWAAPLEVEIGPSFWRAFDAKLSSRHGPETA